ncbi:uncharacterized protein BDZ99DRAFT_409408 [Mytilinidion resinicola]|uniref:Uncharacterized protein n=1 Tax=Mytilinidion resinicola TaxID=574789 RepID=A0A6A6Z5B5_9PEZI|nr:uncharacterized protein BDZ99DRAFT_409408 [Mytilinidion resinicola]KAF2815484.1 hypothetical protein BDZ99DRAFT_409408 [Mytilinidion resinicola]
MFSEMTAPQHASDGDPNVEAKIKEWCGKVDNKVITRAPDGVDTEYEMFIAGLTSVWLSASTWYGAPAGNSCSKDAKITNGDCVDTLMRAMSTCDPNSGVTHGAALAHGCIYFNITLDSTTDPSSPPWNRKAGPSCTSDASGVQSSFFKGLYPKFCNAVNASPKDASKATYTNADYTTPSKRGLERRTPPVSSSEYKGYKFNLEWTGGDGCRADCAESFKELSDQPCGDRGAGGNMATQGSINAGCGTYSFSIDQPPPVTCKPGEPSKHSMDMINAGGCSYGPSGSCLAYPQNYPKSAFQAAVHQFCWGSYDWTVKPDAVATNYFWFDTSSEDPDTHLPPYCIGSAYGEFWQWSPASYKYCKATGGLDRSNSKVMVSVELSQDQTDCPAAVDHKLESPTPAYCEQILNTVADTCIDDKDLTQTGGFYREKTGDGCYDWWIWGIRLT